MKIQCAVKTYSHILLFGRFQKVILPKYALLAWLPITTPSTPVCDTIGNVDLTCFWNKW